MWYVFAIFIGICLIIFAVWTIAYLAYISALWLASFIDLYQIFFYGFSVLLVAFSAMQISKAIGIERDEQRKRQAHQLLVDSLADIKDTLSRNWER